MGHRYGECKNSKIASGDFRIAIKHSRYEK